MLSLHDHPLHVFLRERTAQRGQPHALTGMGNIKGTWNVTDADYPRFLDLVHGYLFEEKRRPQNLVEQRRPDGQSPILIDLDFKYPATSSLQRRFTDGNLRVFIKIFTETLKTFYDLSEFEKLRFFVCLRPTPYEERKADGKQVKDGVHIECPDLVIPAEHQQVIRQAMLERAAVSEAFCDTGYTNPEKDIYDEAMVKKAGWFFYGESKPNIPPYTLHKILAFNPEDDSLTEEDREQFTNRQLLEILSIRYNLEPANLVVNGDAEDEWNRLKTQMTKTRTQPTTPAPGDMGVAGGDVPPIDGGLAAQALSTIDHAYTADEIALAHRLCRECLSPERADGYMSWRQVGWCMHTIDPTEAGFQAWMDFSAKSTKSANNDNSQERADYLNNWRRGQHAGRGLTLKSLHFWAREDNPELYQKIINDDIIEFIERSVRATHHHVAQIMLKVYGKRYRAAINARNTDWYEFLNNTWRNIPQGVEIRNKISTEIADYVLKAKNRIRRKYAEASEGGNAELIEKVEQERFKELHKLEMSMYSADFKGSVMKEAAGLFFEEEFNDKLNINPYLFGTANGVIQLRIGDETACKTEHRQGVAEDFVSFQAGRHLPEYDAIPYERYDPARIAADPELSRINAEIDDFFEKVFPKADLRAYMWRLLASCLEGDNKEQCFYVWRGVGGNGKSMLVELMIMTMGDYAVSLQTTAMTRKRPESGAANPDIMSVKCKRFIYLQEPDEREPINTSRMKQFTGGDMVEARGMYENQSRFKIMGKLHMMCNNLPPIQSMDVGTWRRVRVIPFVSKFVGPEKAYEINPERHVYPRDEGLKQRMKRWRGVFLSRLVHVYETEYLRTGLAPVPAVVMEASDSYKETFDVFAKFEKAFIRRGEAAAGAETPGADFWRAYQLWHGEFGTGPKLAQADFMRRLEETLGEPEGKKRVFRHVLVFMNEQAVDEFDAAAAGAV